MDPSGLYLLIMINEAEGHDSSVALIELDTGKLVAEIGCLFKIQCVEFSPDGKYLVLASDLGSISLWALSDHL